MCIIAMAVTSAETFSKEQREIRFAGGMIIKEGFSKKSKVVLACVHACACLHEALLAQQVQLLGE